MYRVENDGGASLLPPPPKVDLFQTPAAKNSTPVTTSVPRRQLTLSEDVARARGYDYASYLRARTQSAALLSNPLTTRAATPAFAPTTCAISPTSATQTTKPVSQMSATEKLGEVLKRSLARMPAEVRDKVAALLQPESLAMIAGGLLLWAGSHAIGIGEIMDVVLLVGGGLMLGMEVFHVAGDIKDFVGGTLGANSEADLDRAAGHFASAVSTIGVDAIVMLLTHKAAGQLKGNLPRPPVATREMITPEGVRIRVPVEPEPVGNKPAEMRSNGNTSGAGAVREPITEANLSRVSVPGIRNGEFGHWFNSLSKQEMDALWSNPALRSTIESRLRSPGGFHEWLPVSRAPKFREWGVSFEQIQEWRTPTRTLRFTNPEGRHGGPGSSTAHNELFDLIDRARNFNEYKTLLQGWANRRLPGGAASLPPGLRP